MTGRVTLAVALAIVASSALSLPASARWEGDGRWHEDNRWHNDKNNNYNRNYGYQYRPPPVVYGTPYNYGYQAPPVVYYNNTPGFSIQIR